MQRHLSEAVKISRSNTSTGIAIMKSKFLRYELIDESDEGMTSVGSMSRKEYNRICCRHDRRVGTNLPNCASGLLSIGTDRA